MVMIHSQTMRGFVNRDLYFYPLTQSESSVNKHILLILQNGRREPRRFVGKAYVMRNGPTWVDKNK